MFGNDRASKDTVFDALSVRLQISIVLSTTVVCVALFFAIPIIEWFISMKQYIRWFQSPSDKRVVSL